MTRRNIRYTAPELMSISLDEDAPDERPTLQSDIFSLGILLLQVCRYQWPLSVNRSVTFHLIAALSWARSRSPERIAI